MPRPLTAVAVTNAKPTDARREIADGAMPGLRLIIQPSGGKSFAFRYEAHGRSVKITLGPAIGPGALSLVEAREEAGRARKTLANGGDPSLARKAEKVAETARVEAARREARQEEDKVGRVLDRYYRARTDLKSLHEVKRLLDFDVRTRWKGRRINEIERRDVIKLIDDIAARGAATMANRVLANLRAFFGWCIDKGLIESNPCDRVKPDKVEVSRERILDDAEMCLLVRSIEQMDWPWKQFYEFALLTGQRREEVAGIQWSEVNLETGAPVWILPATRTKNGREHAVPLAPRAVEVLKTIPKIKTAGGQDSDFVLTTTGDTSISGFSRAKAKLDETMLAIARKEAQARGDDPAALELSPWRLHDLRRTAASSMARLGIPVSTVEKVLNHVSGTFGGIVGVYQRHNFLAEKRAALDAWAAHIDGLSHPAASNVILLKESA